MIVPGTCKSYIQRLNSLIWNCGVIAPDDRDLPVPAKRVDGLKEETWVIGRGDEYFRATGDENGGQPYFLVVHGGMHIFIRIKRHARQPAENIEVVAYSIKFMGLSQNDNRIESLRFDRSAGKPALNWDDELQENIEHPWSHLHVNFHHSENANNLRVATAFVCPIIVIANFALVSVRVTCGVRSMEADVRFG